MLDPRRFRPWKCDAKTTALTPDVSGSPLTTLRHVAFAFRVVPMVMHGKSNNGLHCKQDVQSLCSEPTLNHKIGVEEIPENEVNGLLFPTAERFHDGFMVPRELHNFLQGLRAALR